MKKYTRNKNWMIDVDDQLHEAWLDWFDHYREPELWEWQLWIQRQELEDWISGSYFLGSDGLCICEGSSEYNWILSKSRYGDLRLIG